MYIYLFGEPKGIVTLLQSEYPAMDHLNRQLFIAS